MQPTDQIPKNNELQPKITIKIMSDNETQRNTLREALQKNTSKLIVVKSKEADVYINLKKQLNSSSDYINATLEGENIRITDESEESPYSLSIDHFIKKIIEKFDSLEFSNEDVHRPPPLQLDYPTPAAPKRFNTQTLTGSAFILTGLAGAGAIIATGGVPLALFSLIIPLPLQIVVVAATTILGVGLVLTGKESTSGRNPPIILSNPTHCPNNLIHPPRTALAPEATPPTLQKTTSTPSNTI